MKAILFRFLAVVISLVIVALLGEAALRVLAPDGGKTVTERSRFCRFDHDLGWAPLENVSHSDEKGGFFFIKINSGCAAPTTSS
jgi:hypothetical protein